MLTRLQSFYYDKTVRNENIKKAISSDDEFPFIEFLGKIGYKKDRDFIHQFPCVQEEMGKLFVADFAFPNEKIIIELDGQGHRERKQKNKDELRDKVFRLNGFTVLRIKTPMNNFDKSFWKSFIQETINEIRYGKDRPEVD